MLRGLFIFEAVRKWNRKQLSRNNLKEKIKEEWDKYATKSRVAINKVQNFEEKHNKKVRELDKINKDLKESRKDYENLKKEKEDLMCEYVLLKYA